MAKPGATGPLALAPKVQGPEAVYISGEGWLAAGPKKSNKAVAGRGLEEAVEQRFGWVGGGWSRAETNLCGCPYS